MDELQGRQRHSTAMGRTDERKKRVNDSLKESAQTCGSYLNPGKMQDQTTRDVQQSHKFQEASSQK
jgi:hypothetical protein